MRSRAVGLLALSLCAFLGGCEKEWSSSLFSEPFCSGRVSLPIPDEFVGLAELRFVASSGEDSAVLSAKLRRVSGDVPSIDSGVMAESFSAVSSGFSGDVPPPTFFRLCEVSGRVFAEARSVAAEAAASVFGHSSSRRPLSMAFEVVFDGRGRATLVPLRASREALFSAGIGFIEGNEGSSSSDSPSIGNALVSSERLAALPRVPSGRWEVSVPFSASVGR
jgi:hypothetical protein